MPKLLRDRFASIGREPFRPDSAAFLELPSMRKLLPTLTDDQLNCLCAERCLILHPSDCTAPQKELLAHLATSDDAQEVRTEALVQLAGRRGRTAAGAILLERLATAPPGSAERVRTALAWLLAR